MRRSPVLTCHFVQYNFPTRRALLFNSAPGVEREPTMAALQSAWKERKGTTWLFRHFAELHALHHLFIQLGE